MFGCLQPDKMSISCWITLKSSPAQCTYYDRNGFNYTSQHTAYVYCKYSPVCSPRNIIKSYSAESPEQLLYCSVLSQTAYEKVPALQALLTLTGPKGTINRTYIEIWVTQSHIRYTPHFSKWCKILKIIWWHVACGHGNTMFIFSCIDE